MAVNFDVNYNKFEFNLKWVMRPRQLKSNQKGEWPEEG
jgi:hypothetical protein